MLKKGSPPGLQNRLFFISTRGPGGPRPHPLCTRLGTAGVVDSKRLVAASRWVLDDPKVLGGQTSHVAGHGGSTSRGPAVCPPCRDAQTSSEGELSMAKKKPKPK